MKRVAYVSTYLPRRCGLATYTHHLRQSMKAQKGWRRLDPVVAIVDSAERSEMNDPALWPLVKGKREEDASMAEKDNRSSVDVVSLQHEFGIFGGEAGAYVLDFIRRLDKPLVTTFHTVFARPEEPYYSIQKEIAERSDRIIVMNRMAVKNLERSFDLDPGKICFIPHGTPVPVPHKREQFRKELGWSGRKVVMTFGLLNRGKGIELVLDVLPEVIKAVPNALYAIVGQTHPEVKKFEGESYREELKAIIRRRDLERHVTMIDRYLDESELVKLITACDVYTTPYPGIEQVTSGTLAYAVGLGRPVLTTPYSYARDLLADCEPLIIPFDDRTQWAERLVELLSDEDKRRDWETRISRIGQEMHWPEVGRRHALLFSQISADAITEAGAGAATCATAGSSAGATDGGRRIAAVIR